MGGEFACDYNINRMQEQPQFVISLDKMSPKMLVGECLDIAKVFLQELIQIYCGNNNYEFPIPNNVRLPICSRTISSVS